MSGKKSIIFVVNPISGTEGKEAIIKKIEEHINRDLYDFQIVKTAYAGHAEEVARNAARLFTDIIVAVGGDGTVNEIARGIVHTDSALGIIPCGSGNGLARHLHISSDPLAAIDLINKGYRLCIDYGKINNKPFFCTCGVGFDAFVSLKFADSGKRGPITYIQNTLKEVLTYKPETYEIENEEMSFKHKAFLIACANASQYGNNAYIAPQASLTDGLLDITILEPFTVLDVPSLAFRLFNKTIDQDSRIKTYQTKRVTIHRAQPAVIHIDGDPVMDEAELNVEIVPKGLNVITSPNIEKSEPQNFLQQLSELLTGLSPINMKK
ncbi:MAG: diacylglycerol kinase family lipid kinase [Phocaeicola sp.]|nr:diacylglycerol kinase family lipid kinase [Phocaeicola sp.]